MKLCYFDCFSGISGDMALGALVDAGADLARIEAELRKLAVSGWTLAAEKVKRGPLLATQVRVKTGESHHHRRLGEILKLIEGAGLPPRAAARAGEVFKCLGEAEARVHGIPVEKVHFHEVGAVDAIVDIVGACVGFELLGIDEFACSALNVGGGQVKTEHGVLPVPAPATVELLKQAGAPVYSSGEGMELVTPTGAAVVAELASGFGAMPAMKMLAAGYGAGSKDLPGRANVLRILMGEAAGARAEASLAAPSVAVIEANIDDMNPQIAGHLTEQALAAGALDIYFTPVQMKKGRAGMLVSVVAEPGDADRLARLLFRETTTIGVRVHAAERRTLERSHVPVETSYGPVRVKVSRLGGEVMNFAPEYDDCRQIAQSRGVPLKLVLAEANSRYLETYGRENQGKTGTNE